MGVSRQAEMKTTKAAGPRPKALIFGISGQDGAYLAHLLLSQGYEVHGTSRSSDLVTFSSLQRLGIRERVTVHTVVQNDFRSVVMLLSKVGPDEIYNLAGQSSVALSFEWPIETFESIATGTLNVLECMRFLGGKTKLFNTASSECFGSVTTPATETTAFAPRSPYGFAKATAFWSVANYREAYSLFACSGIISNHESPLRPDRFVTRKIIQTAVRIAQGSREQLKLGDIHISRDWGWAPEYVLCYPRFLQAEHPSDYIIATGETNSLEDFVREAFLAVGLEWQEHVMIDHALLRRSELDVSHLDPSKVKAAFGWEARYHMRDVVRLLVQCEQNKSLGPMPWVASLEPDVGLL